MLRKLNDKFQENLSRPGIIDTRARYRAAARRLRNTVLYDIGDVENWVKWLLASSFIPVCMSDCLSLCLSVIPHGRTRLPPDKFS